MPQPTLVGCLPIATGHIGLQGQRLVSASAAGNSGAVPMRPGTSGIIGRAGCRTTLLPRIYDPPEGFVASANENINSPRRPAARHAAGYPTIASGESSSGSRRLPAATIEDMQAAAIRRGQPASPARARCAAAGVDGIVAKARKRVVSAAANQTKPKLTSSATSSPGSRTGTAVRRRQSRCHVVRPAVSQCAAGNLRPGANATARRRNRLAADALFVQPGRLLNHGAYRDRSAVVSADLALVARPRQGGVDSPGGRAAGQRA